MKLHGILFLFFSVAFFWRIAGAQVADNSYSVDEPNINPALTSQREISLIGGSSDIEIESTNLISRTRKIEMQKNEIIIALPKKIFSPELYLQQGKGVMDVKDVNDGLSTVTEQGMAMAQLNISGRLGKSLGVGLQSVTGLFSYGEMKNAISMQGLGLNTPIGKSWDLGTYFRKIPGLTQDSGDTPSQWGLGASYLRGSPKSSSLRLELSYNHMTSIAPATAPAEYQIPGEMVALAIESSLSWAVAGLRLKSTRGVFIDVKNFLKDSLYSGERPFSEFILTTEFFFGLRSKKGHSFGVSGFSYRGRQNVYVSQETVEAEVTTTSGSVSYFYIF